MARHPKRKAGKYGARQYQTKYDPNDGTMERALTEIRLGKKVKDIALKYKIPRSTLYDKIKDNHPKKVGRPTVLSHDEEKALASMVELTCEWQVPMDRTDLRYFVQDYLNKKGVKLFRNENLPSMDWTERFIRDFKLKLRSVDNVKPNRSGLSLEDVNKFFINLEKELDGVPPENIWNFDETNFTDDPGKKKVIVSKRRRRVERCMPHSKTSFSVMCCGNPKGEFMPPMIVYKSKCMWENWKKHGPRGASYTMSKNGWFEAQSFTKWFMDLALPRLKELTGKKVIIGDNLGCHYTADVLIECRRHNIAFIPLIPNTTHISQPLDVAVFSPVKKFWRQSLEAWRRETRIKDDLQKTCFPAILRSTFIRIERELGTALESGFRTCGIHPLDRTKIAKKIPSRVHVVDGFDLNIFNDSVLDFLENNRTCSVTKARNVSLAKMLATCWIPRRLQLLKSLRFHSNQHRPKHKPVWTMVNNQGHRTSSMTERLIQTLMIVTSKSN
ncbi:uncharacterized protein [Clytia hemisphaerica]|uniref:uncharacterized protein isoform X1 n=2 Tax=Clytia hemisphaerica TaxID=252671 RepID=UPI0034D5FC54